jgi:hypothetical protein
MRIVIHTVLSSRAILPGNVASVKEINVRTLSAANAQQNDAPRIAEAESRLIERLEIAVFDQRHSSLSDRKRPRYWLEADTATT